MVSTVFQMESSCEWCVFQNRIPQKGPLEGDGPHCHLHSLISFFFLQVDMSKYENIIFFGVESMVSHHFIM